MKRMILLGCLLAACISVMKAEVDPNFYIYLCFGQSNMEGNAKAESVDKTGVDKRFRLLATCNYDSPKRTAGQWYDAVPPLVNPVGGLGPTDYFGRTMVAALPANVRIGVVPVAMGGSPIEMFDKDKYAQKLAANPNEWWAQIAKNNYGGNPYGRLIEMAKKAQQVGVIKGILLHQGCSNNGDPNWPNMVKKIYNDMLTDLGLAADTVPLFVGETLRQENGGACYGHNVQVNRMPSVVPTSHVISSEGLPGNGQDPWHFNAMGYRILGKRYAFAALQLMGRELIADPDYHFPTTGQKKFYSAKSISLATDMTTMPGQPIPVTATFEDNHTEDVSNFMTYTSDNMTFAGALTPKEECEGTAEATYTDFARNQTKKEINIKVRFFPFEKECISTLSGTMNYDEANRTFQFGGVNSLAGWVYPQGGDFSAYRYLVIKLKEKQTVSAQVRIFAQNDLSAGHYSRQIGNNTLMGIDLTKLKYSNKTINPAKISIIAFWANKAGKLEVEDVYLTSNDDFSPLAINAVNADDGQPQPVYNLNGISVGTTADWNRLPKGVYIHGSKVVVK